MIVLFSRAGAVMAAAWLAWGTRSHAQAPKPATGGPSPSFSVISPEFSQLVSFSMLSNFVAGGKAPHPSCIGKSKGRFEAGICAKFRLPAETPYR